MKPLRERLTLAVLVGTALLTGSVSKVKAQPPAQANTNFRIANALTNQAAFNTGAVIGSSAGAQAGFQVGALNNPYYGSGHYSPYWSPAGSFTSGVADIVGAQGQFNIQMEQSKAIREQTKQAKIDTRRKSFDEDLYERANRPTVEDERERARLEMVRRSRNDPPAAEIQSGQALNELLASTQKAPVGPTVPIAEGILKHINVTNGTNYGSLGMLRNGGKLIWPFVLEDADYDENRKKLDQLSAQAFKEAQYDEVKPATIRDMTGTVKKLQGQVRANMNNLTTTDYIGAKRFLNEIDATIRVLQEPKVSNYITGKWVPKANTIGELVAYMTNEGLKFAPAVTGDEAAYTSLHRAFADYEAAVGPRFVRK